MEENLIENITEESEEYITTTEEIEIQDEVTSYEVLHGIYTIVSVICFCVIVFSLYKYLKTVFRRK